MLGARKEIRLGRYRLGRSRSNCADIECFQFGQFTSSMLDNRFWHTG